MKLLFLLLPVIGSQHSVLVSLNCSPNLSPCRPSSRDYKWPWWHSAQVSSIASIRRPTLKKFMEKVAATDELCQDATKKWKKKAKKTEFQDKLLSRWMLIEDFRKLLFHWSNGIELYKSSVCKCILLTEPDLHLWIAATSITPLFIFNSTPEHYFSKNAL